MAAADESGLGGAAREAAPLGRPAPQPRRRGAARLDLGDRGRPRRVLARLGGERRLTDLGHVGQLLHTAATEQQLGVSSLTAWLRQRIADADRDSADEDRALRLDSDAEAVQVLTIHRSKGLEFPIVYHPFAWQPGYIDQDEPPAYHDDQNDDVWTIDVGGDGARHRPAPPAPRPRAARRGPPPPLRRAHPHDAPGDRLVGGRVAKATTRRSAASSSRATPTASSPRRGPRTPDDDEVVARLETLAAQAPGRIAVERVEAPTGARWAGEPRRRVELDASTLRAHTRRALATRLVQRHRLRRARAAGGDRARGRRRRRRAASDRRDGGRGVRRPTPRSSACARHRRRSPPCPAAPTSATSSTACWRRPTSRAPTSRPSSPRAWPSSDAAATSTSATPTPRSPGSPARSRRRSGRCWARSGSATSRRPTASTSSSSSCRSSAATRRRARSP